MTVNCKVLIVMSVILFSNWVHTFEVMYESFEQINGTETVEFLGRVKKINRTTAALNGELILKKPLNNDHKVYFLYSSVT